MKMFDFEAAIFDLDGTLFDSMSVWEKVDIEFLSRRNLPVPESYMEEIRARSFIEAAKYTIGLFALDESPADLIKEWNDMVAYEYRNNIRLKAYAAEYLALLKSRDVKIGTATSLPHTLAEPVLKKNGIYGFFDCFCSTDEVTRGKEFSDVFILASQKLMVPPEACIVFEDILQGVVSAKRAGMKAYCIYDEYSKDQMGEIKKIVDGYLYDFRDAPVPRK